MSFFDALAGDREQKKQCFLRNTLVKGYEFRVDYWHNTVYKYSIMPIQNSLSNDSNDSLQSLLSRSDIWRASTTIQDHNVSCRGGGVDTGYPELNQVLVTGGWPSKALLEIHANTLGSGEWQLLLPVLVDRYSALIGPPHIPYAPALVEAGVDLRRLLVINPPDPAGLLWAAEQVLKSAACEVLLLWEGSRLFRYQELRKLQLAASESACLFFLLRPPLAAKQLSPAALRLSLEPKSDVLSLMVSKQRGSCARQSVCLPIPPSWKALPALSRMPTGLMRCDTDKARGLSSSTCLSAASPVSVSCL